MDSCCETKVEEISTLHGQHKTVLIIVLLINAALFVVEAAAGLLGNSTALLADSLDMLGDSLIYAFSLYVLSRSAAWKAKAALLKGAVMAVFGVGVLLEVIYKTISGILPSAETMGIIGTLVLLGNGTCFLLLYRLRSDDLNMRSTWLCSRNSKRWCFNSGLRGVRNSIGMAGRSDRRCHSRAVSEIGHSRAY